MAIKHMIVIKDPKLWKQIKIAAAMEGTGTSLWIEKTIKEKLAANNREINEFLLKDTDDGVKR